MAGGLDARRGRRVARRIRVPPPGRGVALAVPSSAAREPRPRPARGGADADQRERRADARRPGVASVLPADAAHDGHRRGARAVAVGRRGDAHRALGTAAARPRPGPRSPGGPGGPRQLLHRVGPPRGRGVAGARRARRPDRGVAARLPDDLHAARARVLLPGAGQPRHRRRQPRRRGQDGRRPPRAGVGPDAARHRHADARAGRVTDVACALPAGALLGEGALWDVAEQRLYWVDIKRREVHRFDPARGHDERWAVAENVGCLAVRARGGLVLALRSGFHFFDPATGATTPVVNPEPERAENRFNDGKTDRQGRFWAGSMHDPETLPTGSLYRLDGDLSCRRMLDGLVVSNALCWSPDGRTMYHADTDARTVWAWTCDPASGEIADRRTFVEIPAADGAPD